MLYTRRFIALGLVSGLTLSGCETVDTNSIGETGFVGVQNKSIVEEFIGEGKANRPETIIIPTRITLHNTGNTTKGADAKAHSKFVRNTGFYTLRNGKKRTVSWHFTVDDKQIIQHLPTNEKAYHAGVGNKSSIAIEICMNQGINKRRVQNNVSWLVAKLMIEHKLPNASIVTHKFWTGKNCPTTMLTDGKPNDDWLIIMATINREIAAQIYPMKPENREQIDLSTDFIVPDPSEPEIDEGLIKIPDTFLSL